MLGSEDKAMDANLNSETRELMENQRRDQGLHTLFGLTLEVVWG